MKRIQNCSNYCPEGIMNNNNGCHGYLGKILILILLVNLTNCQNPFLPLTVNKEYLDEALNGYYRINEV